MATEEQKRKNREAKMIEYYWRKESNICTMCGTNEPLPNMTLCYDCQLLNNERHRKRNERLTDEDKQKKRARKREYDRRLCNYRVENHLCYVCGKQLPEDSKNKRCLSCVEKDRELHNRRYNANNTNAVYKDGINYCKICGSDDMYRGSICRTFYDRLMRNFKGGRKND